MSDALLIDSVELLAFHRLFDAQVAKTPTHIAVLFEEESWTYQQLSDYAHIIAKELLSRGLTEEECVGICVDRSPGAIAAMLGIMRGGGAFVPLDPKLPADRIQFMLEDAGIKQVICDQKYADLVSGFGDIQWMTLESLPQARANGDFYSPVELPDLRPEQLAYVMYTSGSTGKPKGVMIESCALTAYCLADIDVYHVTEADRTLHFSTINFDIAIEEIFPPLLTGSSVVVRPRQRVDSHNELSTLIRKYNVTAVHLATAYWHEWVDLMLAHREVVPQSLRLLIATGEKVSVEHFRRWNSICQHEVQWSNAYGPTEATVSSTVFTPDSEWNGEAMPIGKPLKGYEAFILDSQGKACGVGELGELVIAGPALARGYLNRPELTAKAFVLWQADQGLCKRIYKTGDLARWDINGDIEFAGRIDHQIKVGSYRIEPGEIESIINQHPDVLESLVVHEQIANQKFLVAFVASSSKELNAHELASFSRDRLPPYMVPSRYLIVERFPKTINGKVDRKALPAIENAQTPSGNGDGQPLDEMEARLARIWSEVLHVSGIDREDNFFFLGGSSLLVTRVIAKIKQEFNIELPVRDVFANPVLQALALHLKTMLGEVSPRVTATAMRRGARLPRIESQFIASGHEQLFSIYYPGRGAVKRHSVLICGTVGHEYARSHRNLQQLAQMLAEQGFNVLRFDYAGTGNSSGSCESGAPKQWCAEISSAAKWLRVHSQCENFSTIGLRLGATLLSNVEGIESEHQILWDPAISGERFLSQLAQYHRRALQDFVRYSKQRSAEPHQFFGFVTNERAMIDLCKMKLKFPNKKSHGRSLLLTTKDYWKNETHDSPQVSLGNYIDHQQVDDEVLWHWPQYTESAFASANSYRWILNELTGSYK
jgi:amino acid adenylation domain-containing protein